MKANKISIIFCLLALTSCISCFAQHSVCYEKNGFRDGDSLERISACWMPKDIKGKDVCWEMTIPDDARRTVTRVFVLSDSVYVFAPEAYYMLREDKDKLSLLGYGNHTQNMEYSLPLITHASSMSYGDSVSGYFSGDGTYSGRLNLGVCGYSYAVADGYGKLVIDGDTIYDVMRLRIHTESTRLGDINPIAPMPTAEKDISEILHNAPHKITHERLLWYAKGYRYPIVEAIAVDYAEGERRGTASETTHFFLPDMQWFSLPYDEANAEDRKEPNYRPNYVASSDQNGSIGDTLTASATIGSDGLSVDIDYWQSGDGHVKFIVCDVMGRVLATANYPCQTGQNAITISLDRKPIGGVAVIYIEANGETISTKAYQDL